MTTASTTKATRHPVAAELNRARLVEGLVNATKRSSRYLPYQVALRGPKRGELQVSVAAPSASVIPSLVWRRVLHLRCQRSLGLQRWGRRESPHVPLGNRLLSKYQLIVDGDECLCHIVRCQAVRLDERSRNRRRRLNKF